MPRALAFVTILLSLAAASPVQAKTVTITKYYESAGVLDQRARRSDPTCQGSRRPCTVTQDGSAEVGNLVFPAIGGSKSKYTVSIRVQDDIDPMGQVSVTVCEDSTLDQQCSSGDKQIRYACLSQTESLKLLNVAKKHAVVVFVERFYSCTQFVNDIPEEQGGATSGVVKLSYAT